MSRASCLLSFSLLICLLSSPSPGALAQSDPNAPPAPAPASLASEARQHSIFELGELVVWGDAESPIEKTLTQVDVELLKPLNRKDLAEALVTVPSVTVQNTGARNERGLAVRGFDLRQVPLFIDGIPVYVPYDGTVDLSRFTTFDAAAIQVSEGFSSVLYGPNALGGAVNVLSRKPVEPLEIRLQAGLLSGKGRLAAMDAGTRQKGWYAQLSGSVLDRDFFDLSDDFLTNPQEDGGKRANGYRQDVRASLKLGLTPNDTDEYAVGFALQRGEKGNPPYAGTNPQIRPRFWQWPQWDKNSVYLVGTTHLGKSSYIKPRLYYDTYDNTLQAFDDNTYTTQNRPSSFTSIYDDYTYGASLELGTELPGGNELKAALHYKNDTHREHNAGSPETHFRDATSTLGIEDTMHISERVSVVGGISIERRDSLEAQNLTGTAISDFPDNDNTLLNPQAGVFYSLDTASTLHLTVARKSRFPTIKDRYSYRLGQALPNPDLEPEKALHLEAGYSGTLASAWHAKAAVFYSRIDDTIQRVDNVFFDEETGTYLFQLQNVGESEHRGFELGLDATPHESLIFHAAYQFLDRENKSNPEIRLIGTPKHKLFGAVDVRPLSFVRVIPSLEYNSSRFSSSDGVKVDGFVLANVAASIDLPGGLVLEPGINNLFDENYEMDEGFPEEGRNVYVNVGYSLH